MKNVQKVVEAAIQNNSDLVFTYSNLNKNKVSKRHVRPVEVISGNVLVAIDLDKDDYRRFAYDSMEEIEIL